MRNYLQNVGAVVGLFLVLALSGCGADTGLLWEAVGSLLMSGGGGIEIRVESPNADGAGKILAYTSNTVSLRIAMVDSGGSVVSGYTGTVSFTQTSGPSTLDLPGDYTFTGTEGGQKNYYFSGPSAAGDYVFEVSETGGAVTQVQMKVSLLAAK